MDDLRQFSVRNFEFDSAISDISPISAIGSLHATNIEAISLTRRHSEDEDGDDHHGRCSPESWFMP
ncbi:hypothetical protein CH268_17800 [Rhodococcus sp. 06-1460-1B]|nr:hypothetical protein CH268_17800 [Rhodococcus sp. 06-1460-1B]